MSRLSPAHTVIAPDLRGVGCSSTGPGYDADSLADDIGGLPPALGIPPLVMPTLAVSGTGGEARLSADSLRLAARDVMQVEIPDAGHYVQEEQPVALAEALRRLID